MGEGRRSESSVGREGMKKKTDPIKRVGISFLKKMEHRVREKAQGTRSRQPETTWGKEEQYAKEERSRQLEKIPDEAGERGERWGVRLKMLGVKG